MTRQVTVRLADDDVAFLDALVSEGAASDRTDAISRGVKALRRQIRAERERSVVRAVRDQGEVLYPDLEGLASAAATPLDVD